MKLKAQTTELIGSHYEIGRLLGEKTAAVPPLKALHTSTMPGFGETQVQEAIKLFNRWCPGLTEELQGFADALKMPLSQAVFFSMTYLVPRCSQIALPPSLTQGSVPLLARNYEFSHEAEDFCLVKTAAKGKYTHIGTSVLHFGRDDGLNDQGLAITMSSCGFPVGPLPYMRKPKIKGLQFWAVIRTLLENCKDVKEAAAYLQDLPLAYNINLMLVDKTGTIALMETIDGHKEIQFLDEAPSKKYLHATNHPVLPELAALEPKALRHSLIRYNWIDQQLLGKTAVTPGQLKTMLLSPFPDGLCCNYFKDYFGTTKSMVLDPTCGTIELCWGGNEKNGWKKYAVHEPLKESVLAIDINFEKFDPAMAEYVPLAVNGG